MSSRGHRFFDAFAWITLAYTLLVILWGAWVRISGSGDGCGRSWPTCHGEVIPTNPEIQTMIEFSHRVTSGLLVFIVLGLLVCAIRIYAPGSLVRRATWWTMGFLIIECLIGAVLVVFALVGNDDSVQRAMVMAFHLVNTCLLTGAMLLILWWNRFDAPGSMGALSTHIARLLIAAVLVVLAINATGAVTALGDTLYPISVDARTGMVERLEVATFSTTNVVIQMRVLHPFIAIAGALYLGGLALWLGLHMRHDGLVLRWARLLGALVVIQTVAGVVNILLGAPGWMQVVHLLLAKLLWLALVWFCMHVLRHDSGEVSA